MKMKAEVTIMDRWAWSLLFDHTAPEKISADLLDKQSTAAMYYVSHCFLAFVQTSFLIFSKITLEPSIKVHKDVLEIFGRLLARKPLVLDWNKWNAKLWFHPRVLWRRVFSNLLHRSVSVFNDSERDLVPFIISNKPKIILKAEFKFYSDINIAFNLWHHEIKVRASMCRGFNVRWVSWEISVHV